jgi:Ketopantoate reductase PanE/ApbA
MKWLIVGAGAVGQVLALHAARAGEEVAILARDPARVALPLRLWRIRSGRAPVPCPLDVPVLGDVGAFDPDLIVLTVPGDALAGPWLPALAAAAPRARVVTMTPGKEQLRHVAAMGRPVTQGIVAFIAWQAPLPGESLAPGIAFWLPPLLRCPFAGPDAAYVAETLRRGGLPAAVGAGLDETSSHGAAVMALYVTSLRRAGWSLAAWPGSAALATAGRAIAEAHTAITADSGVPAPTWARLLTPRTVAWGTRLVAGLVPFPLEAYLRFHFTKVGGQTRAHVEALAADAAAAGLDAPALREMLTPPPPGA